MCTLNRVKKVIVESLSVNESDITESSTFDDLGADSLDIVELVMAIEEEFDIEIADEVAEELKTIGDVINLIDK